MLFSIGGLLSNLFEFQVTSWQKLWLWQRLVTSGLSDLGTNHFKNSSWQVSYFLLRMKDPDQLATSLFTVDFASPGLQCMGIEMVTPSFLWNTLGSTVRLARITRHQSICLARPEWRWQAGYWDFIGYGGWSWGKLPPPHTQRVTLEQNTEYHRLTLCHVIHKRLPVGRWRLFGGCKRVLWAESGTASKRVTSMRFCFVEVRKG